MNAHERAVDEYTTKLANTRQEIGVFYGEEAVGVVDDVDLALFQPIFQVGWNAALIWAGINPGEV